MTFGSSEVNTLLLTIGLPLMGWLGRKAVKVLTDLRGAVSDLSMSVSILHVTLLGTDDQGGLVRRVEGISTRVHDLAGSVQVLQAREEYRRDR